MADVNEKLYDEWSESYDSVVNLTRDLEEQACRQIIGARTYDHIIELGCGTGKNTLWLSEIARQLTAVDLSPQMQAIARKKVTAPNVTFRLADINLPWEFSDEKSSLITASLVLEHVEDLRFIFAEAAKHLKPGREFYICELHPFKQYSGSKARFESSSGTKVLDCYIHNVSDYLDAANAGGFELLALNEWFDGGDRTALPRLISFLFRLQ